MTLIFGIDFTSAPTRRKLITVAQCRLCNTVLFVDDVLGVADLEQLTELLARPGPWVVAIDFPFGQPRKLVLESHWPPSWQEYVEHVQTWGKESFVKFLREYRDPVTGKRRLPRETDRIAGARSPMQVDFVPVGKMFFEGASLLANSPCAVIPFRIGAVGAGTIVEGYPKMVARKAVGVRSYKGESPSANTLARWQTRADILQWISGNEATQSYGFTVRLSDDAANVCLRDPSGDRLDAILCAMQSAWASARQRDGYGVPDGCDLLEGWIVDPCMLQR